jgi:hypothetical protein
MIFLNLFFFNENIVILWPQFCQMELLNNDYKNLIKNYIYLFIICIG